MVVHHVATHVPPGDRSWPRCWQRASPWKASRGTPSHELNAKHARENDAVTKDATLALLKQNSAAAATAIRHLRDEELDQAAALSLNAAAPLTCQFMLEDHAVRHSWHHLARIKQALSA